MERDGIFPLAELLAPERLARIDHVLGLRTRSVALVLENLHDPHNAAACLRSAEAFGVQDVYIVEGATTAFTPSRRVVQGADKWLHLRRFRDTSACLEALRAADYRVFASDLDAEGSPRPIDAIDFGERVALAFGNEHAGISRELAAGADGCFVIPMRGFSQSFNVSVAVALSLYHAISRRTALRGPEGDLTDAERAELRAEWIRLAVKRGDRIDAALRADAERSGR